MLLDGVFHCLFKSTPARQQRLLPYITPSGLSIGITNITNDCLSSCACDELLVMKSRMPFIIHDAGGSPGCTLQDRNTAGLKLFGDDRSLLKIRPGFDINPPLLPLPLELPPPFSSNVSNGPILSLSLKFETTYISTSSPPKDEHSLN